MSSDKNRPVDLEKWANQIDRLTQITKAQSKRLYAMEARLRVNADPIGSAGTTVSRTFAEMREEILADPKRRDNIERKTEAFRAEVRACTLEVGQRLKALEDWRDREIERQVQAETKDEGQPTNVNLHTSSQYSRGFSDGILAALAAIFRNRA